MMVHCFSRSVCGVTNSLGDMYGLRPDEDAGQGDIDMTMSTWRHMKLVMK